MTTDYANLYSGEDSINMAIANIQQWVFNETKQVITQIGGDGIAKTIAQVGSQITVGLNNVLSDLQVLVADNETVSEALSDVLTIWQTLIGKYENVISNLQQAGGGGILAAGDVKSAQTAWTQLSNYAVTLV